MLVNAQLNNAIIGGYFFLVGVVMIVFRKHVLEFYYDTVGGLPWGWHKIFGSKTLLVIITVLGALSVLGGSTVLLMALVNS